MEKQGVGYDGEDVDDGDEWETVSRRRQRQADSSIRRNTNDGSPGKVEVLFFFSNFPESWKKPALWKVFAGFGVIEDMHIPRRRSNNGKVFWVCSLHQGGRYSINGSKSKHYQAWIL